VLGVAILAVDRAALSGLEWNFAFLLAVGADSFVHLSGASVETAPLITQFFHSFLSVMPKSIQRILWHPYPTPTPDLLNGFEAGIFDPGSRKPWVWMISLAYS